MYVYEKAAPEAGCSPDCPEQSDQCEFYNFGKPGDLSRHDMRVLVFHVLYAYEASGYEVSLDSIVDNLARGLDFPIKIGDPVFKEANSIALNRDNLDEIIKPLLDRWRFDRLGVCTRIIIRMGVWELMSSTTHSTIIINEAIEIAKSFAEQDAYKFVNGVLDEWVKRNAPASSAAPEEPSEPAATE